MDVNNADALSFKCEEDGPMAILGPVGKIGLGSSDLIEGKLRFDSDPHEVDTFILLSGVGMVIKPKSYRLLQRAIQSERLIAKVGSSDTIRFDLLQARDDLKEFDRRCAEMNGKLLTLDEDG